MRIAVAVSGGTDSLFALLKLREEGHDVEALHARFLPLSPEAPDPMPGLSALCEGLGVPLRVVDLAEEFENLVIRPFIHAHVLARTPNPCALCNRTMKFGRLLDAALAAKSADSPDSSDSSDSSGAMATGHYVALAEHPVYGRALKAGADSTKDQSYFLTLTPIERLRRCVFPLAGERKTDIREWLRRRGFEPPLPRESQEICFVPRDDHRAFLQNRAEQDAKRDSRRDTGFSLPGPGPVLLDDPTRETAPGGKPLPQMDGLPVIARHHGLWQYTEGQRKGLGIAWSEPLFVLRRDRERNALIVGSKAQALSRDCTAENINLLVQPELWPARLLARIRYRQAPAPATVELDRKRGLLRLRLAEPQLPPAPGQVAAIYDEDGFALAGAVITEN